MAKGLKYKTKPWKHQLQGLKYLYPRDFGALYTDMGSGKTKIMIDLIMSRGYKKVLILGTKKSCRIWPGEFRKHAYRGLFDVLSLERVSGRLKPSVASKHFAAGKFAYQIVVNNYDSVWRKPFKDYILKFGFDCVICDESHRIKSPGSKVSRFLTQLGRRVPHRYLMTGTPLAQSPLDIYAQYRFLDPSIFGTNFEDFKQRYANWIELPGGFTIQDKRKPWKNLDKLYEKMFSCAFFAESDLDLPPTQDIEVNYDMSPKAQKYYKELIKEGCLELDEGDVIVQNPLVMVGKRQQLTSGYLTVHTDEGKEILEVDKSRQLCFKELIEDFTPGEPTVVFCKYKKDITNVLRICKAIRLKTSELSGRRDTLEDWEKGLSSVLVVQISAGAEGIDLTRARYAIYYSQTNALWQYKQSRKRLDRPGQTRPVVFYHIVAKRKGGKTIDEIILNGLQANEELLDRIMRGEIEE